MRFLTQFILVNFYPLYSGFRHEDSLPLLVFNLALKYDVMKPQENKEVLELNGLNQMFILMMWFLGGRM